MWVGVGLSVIFVAIRTHVQYRKTGGFFINDYCIFFALVLHLAAAIVYQIAIPYMYEIEYFDFATQPITQGFMDDASLFLRMQFALDFLLWTTLWAVKFSLLFFFWRLFDSVQTSVRIFWWIMFTVTASTWITLVVLQNLACDPIKDFFTPGMFREAVENMLTKRRKMRLSSGHLLLQSGLQILRRDRHRRGYLQYVQTRRMNWKTRTTDQQSCSSHSRCSVDSTSTPAGDGF